jgi:Putative DNA-binding domain
VTHLSNIQDAFQRYMLRGDAAIEAHVVGTKRVPVATRLGIYGDGYRLRLIEALQSSYPVLAEVLGEDDFEMVANRYVATHESPFFSIRYYGHELADFLATDAACAKAPVLPELARWEWAMAAIFDAADTERVAVEELARVAPEEWAGLQFQFSSALEVLSLQWNVPQLWKAVTEHSERPELSVQSPAAHWLLWRNELQIYFRLLLEEEARALAAARAGRSFGDLCVLLCEHLEENEASRSAAAFLRSWVQSGLITAAQATFSS